MTTVHRADTHTYMTRARLLYDVHTRTTRKRLLYDHDTTRIDTNIDRYKRIHTHIHSHTQSPAHIHIQHKKRRTTLQQKCIVP